MSFSTRKLQRICMDRTAISPDSTKMEQVLSGAKAAYYAWEENSTLSRGEFILQQVKFIKKRWWILQALVLVGLWAILKYGDSTYSVQRSIGLFAPLFALLILPEIWKNRTADAMEVEYTARFSLRQIYAARMTLFGIADLLMLTVFFAAASSLGRITAGELVIQFLVPFNITACICFRTLYSKHIGSEVLAMVLCVVWIALWERIVLQENLYQTISVPVWVGLLVASATYLAYWIQRGQSRTSQMWEVKPQWN